ncbi:hypothetical protein AFLA_004575 [Aspergillus flavus NRRL3357]|nr:hypothetical protein AFLA_004575 [Aspergillus flavus NRRL3357]
MMTIWSGQTASTKEPESYRSLHWSQQFADSWIKPCRGGGFKELICSSQGAVRSRGAEFVCGMDYGVLV